jgi:hypothetical protein
VIKSRIEGWENMEYAQRDCAYRILLEEHEI